MPLSKARDAERKRQERAKIRLDKQLTPPAGSQPIQPTSPFHRDAIGIVETPYSRLSLVKPKDRLDYYREGIEPPDIDADGNIIPDYE